MDIDLTRNYFELFGFAQEYSIDLQQLDDQYRALQSKLHPDRYTNSSDQERRISVQTTAYVNEAYTTLKDDLKRAHYLLQLNDIDFNADTETSSDAEFLMQTMELHEQVEEAANAQVPLQALDNMSKKLKQDQEELIAKFTNYYDQEKDFVAAKDVALKLHFYVRLTNQVRKQQEQLEEELL